MTQITFSKRKPILMICVLLGVIVVSTIIITFLLWTTMSFYLLKWLKRNIDAKLYFESYKNSCKTTLETYGNLPVKRIYIVRTPVNNFLSFLLDVITWKNYSRQLNQYRVSSNDNAFFPIHTYMIVEVELENKMRKSIVVEKSNGIEVTANFRKYESQDMLNIKLKKEDKFTLNKLLNKTKERIGNQQFFNWHFYKNNCQQFTIEVLKSLQKNSTEYENFVSQEAFFKAIIIPDAVMYVINSTINAYSLMESVYFDLTL